MKILVTGATGFLGSAISRKLIEAGNDVKLLVRKSSDRSNTHGLKAEIVVGDLTEQSSLLRACRGVEALYHVAADYRLWSKNKKQIYENNVTGTKNIMQAALASDIGKIVYTSSVATLGTSAKNDLSNENTPVRFENMIGHYKRSKFLAENVVQEMITTKGLPAVIVNPSTPVGPRDIKPTPTGRIIRDAALGKIPAYVNTGLNLAHVDDIALGHLLAYEKGVIGRRYILGGENLSLRDILLIVKKWSNQRARLYKIPRVIVFPVAWISELIAHLTNGPEPQVTLEGLRMSKNKMFFSSARAAEELGYTWRNPKEGINDSLNWFRKVGYID